MDRRDTEAEARREEEERALARLRHIGGVERVSPDRPMGYVAYPCGHRGYWFTDVPALGPCVTCGTQNPEGRVK